LFDSAGRASAGPFVPVLAALSGRPGRLSLQDT
jgi:hypothetical protein